MIKTFNLSKFRKQAFYEDGKGQVQKQTRAMMNCYRAKLSSGMSAHEAWEGCLEEYNTGDKGAWGTKYAKNDVKKRVS